MNGTKRIAVLFGGCSSEHEISLHSAYSVIINIDRERYTPVLIGITRDGRWYYYDDDPVKIFEGTWESSVKLRTAVSPDPSEHALLLYDGAEMIKLPIDAAFPVLHGKNGEDGTVQGVFELAGIPVIGCGVLSSALCMDKDKSHSMAKAAGINVPRSFTADKTTPEETAFSLAAGIGYPLFVKPNRGGSSFGTSKAETPDELMPAIADALQYDELALVEECIPGFEVGCSIIGTRELTVGCVDEIELFSGFLDYEEKYVHRTAKIHVPARIDDSTTQRIKAEGEHIYRALGCSGFARVDMFLTPSGRIVFNEVNTIPGMTEVSRFPNMLAEAGIPITEAISAIIADRLG